MDLKYFLSEPAKIKMYWGFIKWKERNLPQLSIEYAMQLVIEDKAEYRPCLNQVDLLLKLYEDQKDLPAGIYIRRPTYYRKLRTKTPSPLEDMIDKYAKQ